MSSQAPKMKTNVERKRTDLGLSVNQFGDGGKEDVEMNQRRDWDEVVEDLKGEFTGYKFKT